MKSGLGGAIRYSTSALVEKFTLRDEDIATASSTDMYCQDQFSPGET